MLDINSIKEFLGIKDINIQITKLDSFEDNGVYFKVIYAKLTQPLERCPFCGMKYFTNGKPTCVKNGTKSSKINYSKDDNEKTTLLLTKQRYLCKQCDSYFTAETTVVRKHCFISNKLLSKIKRLLVNRISASFIAKQCNVSLSTVIRVIQGFIPQLKRNKEYLPEVLLVDEFNAMKNRSGKFMFSCADGQTGELLEVLPTREYNYIVAHFLSYSAKARRNVKFLVTDMHSAYIKLAKNVFPKAKIIIDRFHIVQHMNRCFNNERIRTMKLLKQYDSVEGKQYRQLKSLWRYLLIPKEKLNGTDYKSWRNFQHSLLTEKDVINRLTSISKELKVSYDYFQDLLEYFHKHNASSSFKLIDEMPKKVPECLKEIRKTCLKYRKEIRNAINQPYSNGKLECKHTHIKALKRCCYGFRNYFNTKVRIFLINGLIDVS